MTVSGSVLHADEARGVWSIETPDLSLSWRRTDAGEVVLAGIRAGVHEWAAGETSVFTVDGPTGPSTHLENAGVSVEGNRLTLTGTLRPSGLTAMSVWTVADDASVVTSEFRVCNDTERDVALGALSSLHLCVPAAADRQLNVLAGGRWHEAMPPRGYRLETHDLDEIRGTTSVGTADDGRSSGEHVPWLALTTADDGLLAALVWSGRWRLDARRDGDDVDVALGIADFARTLAPGEEIALPGLVLAGYRGDLDEGANAWRAWLTHHWTPPVPENWPWVQYNHWYAYYGDIDEERLFVEAKHAAAMGCEVFVIDDGWFLGRRPDSYHEGWGNWHEDPAKFPNGLRAFGDRVRGLGMKFGLWVEPERADPAGVLLREHPGFVATRDGALITRTVDGSGVHLCLGSPEVQTWMAADMIRVVRDYGVDWLKWDYNIGYGLGCNDPHHGHQAGDGHHAYTLGLYRVLEELRAACPDLVIENCASGGHRVDMGTLRYTHTNWLSDYTDRAASCRQHAQGAGLMLPLHHLNTWVLHDRDTDTEFRSRMGGAFGVSSFMGRWSADERAALMTAIEEYKRLRPLLAGDRYLLSGPLHQDWDVWQFVAPDFASFAVFAFHDASRIDGVTVTPRGLDPERMYRIEREGGESVERTGVDLMVDGLDLRLAAGGSTIIWGTAV
jgi:alpha-galactosidase